MQTELPKWSPQKLTAQEKYTDQFIRDNTDCYTRTLIITREHLEELLAKARSLDDLKKKFDNDASWH
jgi:BMFP domain-containing protein YqiC